MIPLTNLKKQYACVESRIKEEVINVLDSGQYIMGAKVQALEERLAQYVGVDHCITCASGTDALYMSLLAKDVGAGDIIITTPFTFFATAEVIALTGAVPVFVDVERDTFNISAKNIALAIEAIKKKDPDIYPLPDAAVLKDAKLRGIIAVDLFGLPANYDAINQIAKQESLFVIEDAAQSFGASIRGCKAGALSEIACTSFFPAKPLGCYGDGGAIFTNNKSLAEILRSIRIHGQGTNKYENIRLGVTSRLDAIQAAVVDVKLDIFDEELKSRQRIANLYSKSLCPDTFSTPFPPQGFESAWAQYTIVAKDKKTRQQSIDNLTSGQIGYSIYYPIALHDQKAFKYLAYNSADFPVSNYLAHHVFSIPMHPYLEEIEITKICKTLQGGVGDD